MKDMSEQLMNNYRNNRPTGETSIKRSIFKDLQDKLQEDIKSAQKSNDTEDHFETFLYGKPSMILTHFFVYFGINANTVTFLSLVFGVAGSFFFYTRHPGFIFAGILIEFIAVALDCSDGQVARLTHTSSQLGRFLDGLVDSVNFAAIYIALGLRMMIKEKIPFTDVKWGAFIWIVIFVSGYCHAEQARMADYYRSLHLHFLEQNNTAFFTSSKRIKAELSESRGTPLYNRLYLAVYWLYTKAQEKMSPNTQRLLKAIEDNGGVITVELSAAYTSKSRKYVQLTNVLTFHLRTCVLFLLLLFRLHPFFFPFNILVLGGIMIFMISKYEKIASEIYDSFFANK